MRGSNGNTSALFQCDRMLTRLDKRIKRKAHFLYIVLLSQYLVKTRRNRYYRNGF